MNPVDRDRMLAGVIESMSNSNNSEFFAGGSHSPGFPHLGCAGLVH
jgi:hypothetical protein